MGLPVFATFAVRKLEPELKDYHHDHSNQVNGCTKIQNEKLLLLWWGHREDG
jgi:hypothetical protein